MLLKVYINRIFAKTQHQKHKGGLLIMIYDK